VSEIKIGHDRAEFCQGLQKAEDKKTYIQKFAREFVENIPIKYLSI